MTIGQRILQARQEAGLSQRELAGSEMTRNMLSALEHDTAKPSLGTLELLARRLNRPVSFLLGETGADGSGALEEARQRYRAGDLRGCLELTQPHRQSQEAELLTALCHGALAEAAIAGNRPEEARDHLAAAQAVDCMYITEALRRQWAVFQAQCAESPQALPALVAAIGTDDPVFLLRAKAALAQDEPREALRWLDCMTQPGEEAIYCRGVAYEALGEYRQAAEQFHRIEADRDVNRHLETCYVQLEDFRQAYFYLKAAQNKLTGRL